MKNTFELVWNEIKDSLFILRNNAVLFILFVLLFLWGLLF